MARTKRKSVISADAEHLARVAELIRVGRYQTLSEFVREAMAEKLERLRRVRLAEQVARYCEQGYQDEDLDLIAVQAFPGRRQSAKR